MVWRADKEERVGLVSAYRLDDRNRHAYVAVVADERHHSTGHALEGLALLVDYCFALRDLRKVYAEATELTYEAFQSGAGRIFEVEGRLKEHDYYAGRYWDKLVLSVTRERWFSGGRLLLQTQGQESAVSDRLLDYDQFAAVVAKELSLSAADLKPDPQLEEDLSLDSLDRIRLIIKLEELVGQELPEELIEGIRTMQDAYYYYEVRHGSTGASRR